MGCVAAFDGRWVWAAEHTLEFNIVAVDSGCAYGGSRLKATLMKVDITRNTDSYKLKITAKKTIGGVGEQSWEDYGELNVA